MSTSLFRLYQDPDNADAKGSHKIHSTGAKSFVRAKQSIHSGVGATPRKALVDINHDPASIRHSHNQGRDFKKPPVPPAGQSVVNKAYSTQEPVKQKAQIKSAQHDLSTFPPFFDNEIEHMVPIGNEPDDFEDVLPKAERITTYLSKLIRWRPSCLVDNDGSGDDDGSGDESFGSEADIRRVNAMAEELDNNPDWVREYGHLSPELVPEVRLSFFDDGRPLYDDRAPLLTDRHTSPSDTCNQSPVSVTGLFS